MHLVLSAFTSSPISLVTTTRASAFSFTVCMLPPSILTSSAYARSWWVPFNFKPSWFTWTLLMAYSKAKLNGNGDRIESRISQFCLHFFFLPKEINNRWDENSFCRHATAYSQQNTTFLWSVGPCLLLPFLTRILLDLLLNTVTQPLST